MPCITLRRFSTSALSPSRSVVETVFSPDPPVTLLDSVPDDNTSLLGVLGVVRPGSALPDGDIG